MNQQVKQGFHGLRVVSFESRLADAMQRGLAKHGADGLVAPSMQEIPLERNPEAISFGDKLMAGQIDVVIFMTGVGARMLFKVLLTKYSEKEMVDALRKVTTVVRGPKPVRVMKEFGMDPTLIAPEPNTWWEIIEEMDYNRKGLELKNKTVAVQEYGIPNEDLIKALKKRGAHIIQVPVYRWALPDDRGPLEQALREILEGKVRIVLITNAVQIRHLVRLASEKGVEEPFRKAFRQVVIASVGPTASEAIRECGFSADFEPSRTKMGHLITETAEQSALLVREKLEGRFSSVKLVEKPVTDQDRKLCHDSLFMKACRREDVPVTPVWLMRQAGRYQSVYRKLRSKVSFLELCKNKELVAEVTIDAVQKIHADAAIIFSDILLIVEPLGLKLKYEAGDGPVIGDEAIDVKQIDQLKEIEPEESLSFVYDAIRLTRSSLDQKIPLIGFSGAPFTLASYIIEGGSSRFFLNTKKFMQDDPGAWKALMEKIARGVIRYLQGQIEAGADAVQLFDSWVGCLSDADYRQFVLPYTKQIFQSLPREVPAIHFGTGTAHLLKSMCEAGGQVMSVDYRVALSEAWDVIGHDVAIQGNLDPAVLCSSIERIKKAAKSVLDQAGNRPGHIFNLGHGVLPQTPEDNVRALIDFVHEASAR